MATEKDSSESIGDVDDKLTVIDGISETRERDLHRLGIRRFADLIRYTHNELAKLLLDHTNDTWYSVRRLKSYDWIGQAKILVEQSKSETISSQQQVQQATPPDTTFNEPEWFHHAEFTLFFDYKTDEHGEEKWQTRIAQIGEGRVWNTRVYHQESDTEAVFDGIEPLPWVNWILEHADLNGITGLSPAKSELTTETYPLKLEGSEKISTKISEGISIEFVSVQVSEAESASDKAQKNLIAEIRFQLSGARIETLLAERTTYQAELHTIHQEDGSTDLVASERDQLQPGSIEYMCPLTFPLPALGRYELQSIVLLFTPSPLMAIHQGPTINVIP